MKTKDPGRGNGDLCLIDPEHGATFVLRGGAEWCAHQSHDGKSPAMRSKQQDWLDNPPTTTTEGESNAEG
jgi:hypothetical protein